MQFIENPGFNDPAVSDADLWISLNKWLRNEGNEVVQGGYAGFINIVSVPISKRPAKDSYTINT